MAAYIHDFATELRLDIRDHLTKGDAAELLRMYRTASTRVGKRRVVVRLNGVREVDEAGAFALRQLARAGAVVERSEPRPSFGARLRKRVSRWLSCAAPSSPGDPRPGHATMNSLCATDAGASE